MANTLLFADDNSLYIILAAIFAFLVMAVFGFVMLLLKQYKRCPSNRVLVIYGKAGRADQPAKLIHGGAVFVVPLVQEYAYLSLEPIRVQISLRGAPSSDNVRVHVPSRFTVAVGRDPAVMQNAAVRLLGLTTEEIRKQAEEIIVGQLRQVIASMGIEQIERDRDTFHERVQKLLEPALGKIGLELINMNITDIVTDIISPNAVEVASITEPGPDEGA